MYATWVASKRKPEVKFRLECGAQWPLWIFFHAFLQSGFASRLQWSFTFSFFFPQFRYMYFIYFIFNITFIGLCSRDLFRLPSLTFVHRVVSLLHRNKNSSEKKGAKSRANGKKTRNIISLSRVPYLSKGLYSCQVTYPSAGMKFLDENLTKPFSTPLQ